MAEEAPSKAAGRGQPQTDTPRREDVAEDVFRRVAGLGGFMIVAFVAPMGGAPQNSAMAEALSAVGGEANEINRELAQLVTSRFKARYRKSDEY